MTIICNEIGRKPENIYTGLVKGFCYGKLLISQIDQN